MQIGVEEYLGLVFPDRPEPDYVHGEVVERAMPTVIHARIQALLAALFVTLSRRIAVITMTELRVQIEPRHFRVIDVAVYCDLAPEGRFATIRLLPEFDFEVSSQELFKDV
jgi:Uma2 family endonuclease